MSVTTTSAGQIVSSFLDAMNRYDYTAAKTLVTEDLSFDGVLGKRNGAEAYFNDMDKMRFRYDVLKVFEGGDNDVTVWYNIDMGKATLLTAGWYQLREGKISSIRVVFDPRPVLE